MRPQSKATTGLDEAREQKKAEQQQKQSSTEDVQIDVDTQPTKKRFSKRSASKGFSGLAARSQAIALSVFTYASITTSPGDNPKGRPLREWLEEVGTILYSSQDD